MTGTRTNSGRTLRPRGPARSRRRALAVVDRLPPAVRRALHEALVDWDPRWVRAELRRRLLVARTAEQAIAATVRLIAAGDETEIWSHAASWPLHVRAGASLQRYGGKGLSGF